MHKTLTNIFNTLTKEFTKHYQIELKTMEGEFGQKCHWFIPLCNLFVPQCHSFVPQSML